MDTSASAAPPDRIRVGFCPACGRLHGVQGPDCPAVIVGARCGACPAAARIVWIRYQLTRRMGTLKRVKGPQP